jgi:hypothetical protein
MNFSFLEPKVLLKLNFVNLLFVVISRESLEIYLDVLCVWNFYNELTKKKRLTS